MGLAEFSVIGGVAVLLGGVLWFVLQQRPDASAKEDDYTRGLELWLGGDRPAAIEAMRRAVSAAPESVDPYLQLGLFLRKNGDARRAAALHRGLAARPGLDCTKRTSIALALAEDLNDLGRWDESRALLDDLQKRKPATPRFWHARFRQWLGQGDHDAAARTLREAVRRVDADHQDSFQRRHELFQLDRALDAIRNDATRDAGRLLKDVAEDGPYAARVAHVRALIKLQNGEPEKAAEIATSGLLHAPEESELLLPVLQKSLLDSGRYERTIPVLESACQSDRAPASLWIALALLHEKVGDREMAIRVLESKSGDERLTLAAAAPFLRILIQDLPDSDFTRIWDALHTRTGPRQWHCHDCGAPFAEVRWFCPACHAFDGVEPGPARTTVSE